MISQKQEAVKFNILFQKPFSFPIQSRSVSHTHLLPASNSTFVLHAWNLFHISSSGQILKELELSDKFLIWSYHMLSENLLIIFLYHQETSDYSIWQWNLTNNKVLRFRIENHFPEKRVVNFFVFEQSNLFSIVQTFQMPNDVGSCKVSFYNYPLNSEADNYIHCFSFNLQERSKMASPVKFNKTSGIVWKKNVWNNQFQSILIFDLKLINAICKYQIKCFENPNKELFYYTLKDLWELDSQQIYLKFQLQLNQANFRQRYPNTHGFITNNQLTNALGVYEVIWNPDQNTFRVPLFSSKSYHHVQFSTGLRKINHFWQPLFIRPYMMLMAQQYLSAQIIYVQKEMERKLGEQPEAYKGYQAQNLKSYKVVYPEYDNSIYLQYTLQSKEKGSHEIKGNIVKIVFFPFNAKEVSTFLLLQKVSDFDEDLLECVSDLISDESGFQGWRQRKYRL